MKTFLHALYEASPFLYILACWVELAQSGGTPAPWNLLGRFLLAIF